MNIKKDDHFFLVTNLGCTSHEFEIAHIKNFGSLITVFMPDFIYTL